MSIRLGDIAPDFEQDSSEGRIRFHDWLGDSWGVLFSHPADFTPVCTTEFIGFQKAADTFRGMNCELIGLSIDSLVTCRQPYGKYEIVVRGDIPDVDAISAKIKAKGYEIIHTARIG